MFTNPPHSRHNLENAPKEDYCLRIDGLTKKSKQPASSSDEDSRPLESFMTKIMAQKISRCVVFFHLSGAK